MARIRGASFLRRTSRVGRRRWRRSSSSIFDFRFSIFAQGAAMALIDELKRILEREKLYVQDKFEEWVNLARRRPTRRSTASSPPRATSPRPRCSASSASASGLPGARPRRRGDRSPREFVEQGPGPLRPPPQPDRDRARRNGTVRVASCSPLDTHPIDELSAMLDRIVEPVLATARRDHRAHQPRLPAEGRRRRRDARGSSTRTSWRASRRRSRARRTCSTSPTRRRSSSWST